jgi:hypothetical protein
MKPRYALLLLLAWLCAQPGMAQERRGVLTVGPGKDFALPSAAAQAARAGNLIQIEPGTYADCARWDADNLVIEGTGPGVVITDKVCDDKGLFITRGRDIIIRNITFASAHATSHNGSGIRAEGPNLTVENSRFIDDEDGILAGNNADSAIVIRGSFFSGNGNCIAACAHGIYANHVALLRVENSEFVEQHVGHHIKSRALRTEVVDSFVHDGPNGSASYLVDMPNGGSGLISGNRFEKGPLSQNRLVAISVGAERAGGENPAGEIVVENNEFANDTGSPTTFVKNYTAFPITLSGNRFTGAVVPLGKPEDTAPKQ